MTALAHAWRHAAATPWRPLVELTKPRLSLLVLFTALAGYGLALDGPVEPLVLLHTLIGTALIAGGANAFNQVRERDADARMQRTRHRPIPDGRLDHHTAVRFAVVISVLGVVQLGWGVNVLTAALGLAALLLYVAVYTPLKRLTVHNTLVGAIVGALPPMMGWSAARGDLAGGAWVLAALLFVWQLPHFFAIAWMYREDYARGGFQMLGVVDAGGRVTARQVPLLAILLIPVSLMPAVLGLAGPLYARVALVLGCAFVSCCLWPGGPSLRMARRAFLASIIYLPCLLAAMLVDKT